MYYSKLDVIYKLYIDDKICYDFIIDNKYIITRKTLKKLIIKFETKISFPIESIIRIITNN